MQTDVQADVQADEQAETAQASQPPPAPLTPSWAERAIDRIKLWFTTGNVPVKVGMVVLLAGVAALLRYASDQGWLRMPIELRLAGVSAAALAALK